MELRVLQYFLAVAREESITRAAEVLHITQPTLSRQLSQLEEELGTRLFERGTRHITLTPDGLLLRRRAEEISELVDKTRQELALQDETLAGTVALGSGELEAVRVLPRLFQAFRLRYPLVDYTLYSGTADDVKERMDRGLLDAGILLEPVDVEKYEFIRLPVREQWIALMPADDPLAAKSAVTVEDLAARPLILPQRPRVRSEVARWFGERHDGLDVPFTSNMSTNAAVLVAGGMGIADSLLFHEYILDKFPCFSAELPEDFPALRYQCEYLFGGEEEDRENLEAYLNRLLLVRLGFNTVYLAGSSARQAELEALASAMTGAVGLPMLSGLVKAALEILWAYEESLVDIRTLCTGGEVPLTKDASSFACSIQQIFSFAPEPQKEAEGLDYREYMRLLLNTLPMEEKAARALDMAEHTIRVLRDRGSFQVDSGIFRMEVYAAFRGEGIFSGRAGGYTWSTRAGYTYGES